ncbi:unnamed protein product [Heterosigma akashiwo]
MSNRYLQAITCYFILLLSCGVRGFFDKHEKHLTFSVESIQRGGKRMSQADLKKQVGYTSVDNYVRSGMVVGLGTGSTAYFAVERLGQKLASGELRDVVAVPTSEATRDQALGLNIPLVTLATHPELDVAIDGADEVDPQFNLVKGRGGALLREKMVEASAKLFVCIVDDSKFVEVLGGSKGAMPVEVTQFCWKATLEKIRALPSIASISGARAQRRENKDGSPYVTDNGNYIIDLYFEVATPSFHSQRRQTGGGVVAW